MTDRSLAADAQRSASEPVESASPSASPASVSATNGTQPASPPPASPISGPTPPSFAPVRARPIPVASAVEDAEADEVAASWSDVWMYVPSWLTSMVFHLSLVVVLALLTTVQVIQHEPSTSTVISTEVGNGEGGDDLMAEAGAMGTSDDLAPPAALSPPEISDMPAPGPDLGELVGSLTPSFSIDAPVIKPTGKGGSGGLEGIEGGIGVPGGTGQGNSLALRLSPGDRAGMVKSYGGTPESELAVALALKWLAEHQNSDGSWTFDHQKSPKCHGSCGNPGSKGGKIAATAMALLPFLGTGQTHLEGDYQKVLDRGLHFLVRTMEMQGNVGSLWDQYGEMYGHGLASIVLCEAYGMTHDQFLEKPAQGAINFIVAAQDSHGGGWRYVPQTPGDTSVVGWQLMALKSAQMAYLRVPPDTLRKTSYFLDHVQAQKGAMYGYRDSSDVRPATSAIGLLCRMYLGWTRESKPLQNGVKILDNIGPSIDKSVMANNMYFNYYATQVMHHYGGYPWQKWNRVMREYLIETQGKKGHERGSWYFEGADHGSMTGGRLYCTAMACMTLEVYYRHMPLYREQSINGN